MLETCPWLSSVKHERERKTVYTDTKERQGMQLSQLKVAWTDALASLRSLVPIRLESREGFNEISTKATMLMNKK